MKQEVSDLQLSVMQEFFKIRMKQAYGNNWVMQVKSIVEAKFESNDRYKHNYQGLYDVLTNEGVENINEKRMDITNISSLMLNDFFNECKLGTNFRQQIRNIQTDKNQLVSHIPDRSDVLNVKILEMTALKNLRGFLNYLRNAKWNYAKRYEFIDKYMALIEEATSELFVNVDSKDKGTVEYESNRINYLNRLVEDREVNLQEYIPLSYKVDDATAQRYDLEEIYENYDNKDGFVIFSNEAGYGKTWSIQELAGQCAVETLKSDDKKTPILIKMGELAVSEEPIVKAVQEIFYPDDDNVEKARRLLTRESIVLFIDGMDEADKNNKEPVHRELVKLRDTARDIRIIGSTRASDRQWYPAELPKYIICDLSDKQVENFINKLIIDENQRKTAMYDFFENVNTDFLRNIRSPFYIKCFIDFIMEGEKSPSSDTDMMNRCINKMIDREINIKGFKATIQIVNDYLSKFSEMLGDDKRFLIENEALRQLSDELIYDTDNYASIAQIKDTLVELHILREVSSDKHPVILGFWHEQYKSLYSPVALDDSIWDW